MAAAWAQPAGEGPARLAHAQTDYHTGCRTVVLSQGALARGHPLGTPAIRVWRKHGGPEVAARLCEATEGAVCPPWLSLGSLGAVQADDKDWGCCGLTKCLATPSPKLGLRRSRLLARRSAPDPVFKPAQRFRRAVGSVERARRPDNRSSNNEALDALPPRLGTTSNGSTGWSRRFVVLRLEATCCACHGSQHANSGSGRVLTVGTQQHLTAQALVLMGLDD